MNRIIDEFRKDDERILDRLVDGELTEEDRKTLLLALDDEPGAWRRCALAFLESQTWGGDLKALRNEPALEAPPVVEKPTVAPPPPPRPSRFFELCLAMAASVALAFGVGVWVRSMWSTSGDNPFSPRMAVDGNLQSPGLPTRTVDSSTPWHANLSYDDPETEGPDKLVLPLVEPQASTDSLRQQRSALPDELRRELESAGHRVNRRQQFQTIPLKDGRQLIVPVEQLDVIPNRRPAY
jgi:hypothetical protein